ncbi:MAG: hypothetical protein IT210_07210 [Armatimonadetes bacterium]|nr:hypothetical protein [Armatimonadota bacterium]
MVSLKGLGAEKYLTFAPLLDAAAPLSSPSESGCSFPRDKVVGANLGFAQASEDRLGQGEPQVRPIAIQIR